MAESTLPYVTGYGNIKKVLEKIKTASTPPRFTQDFLATKLDMSGGSSRPVIPFLKRTGFLGSDGVPTDLYKRFRNHAQSGVAAAQALRIGYKPLFEINEYVHEAKDTELRGLIVQVTGAEKDSQQVRVIMGSFKVLKAFADFSTSAADEAENTPDAVSPDESDVPGDNVDVLPRRSYTQKLWMGVKRKVAYLPG
jgi:Family of unknown function (DUF5343)